MMKMDGINQDDLIAEHLVIVEAPDASLPAPVVHWLYYAIPRCKFALLPEDFKPVPDASNMLYGGLDITETK